MSNSKNQILSITKLAITAALYVVLTVLVSPLSYGDIQIRFSEVLLLLCFFDKKYGIALVVGCAVANLFSPIPLDFLFGTMQTVIAVLLIGFLRPLILSLILSILSMVIIGIEISVISDISWWMASLTVMAGEAVVLLLIAYPLSFLLKKSKTFMEFVKLSKGENKNEGI